MLSYTRAAGFPPCFNTPAACRPCWAVHPAIHAGLAAISHRRLREASPATGLTTPPPDHRNGSASRRRHNRACQNGYPHRPLRQAVVPCHVRALARAGSEDHPVTRCRTPPASGIYVLLCVVPRAGHRASSQVRACSLQGRVVIYGSIPPEIVASEHPADHVLLTGNGTVGY
jgi:hypothetical protein